MFDDACKAFEFRYANGEMIWILFQIVAAAGFNVTVTEVSEELAEKSKKTVIKNAERLARKKFGSDEKLKSSYVQETSARIRTTANYEESVKNADLVIEAIVENLEAKHKLFAFLDKVIQNFIRRVNWIKKDDLF